MHVFLASTLVGNVDLLMHLLCVSKADSTVEAYYAGSMRWKKLTVTNYISMLDVLPANPFHVTIYLFSVVQRIRNVSPVTTAYTGRILLLEKHLRLIVKNVLENVKRRLATPIEKKEPITLICYLNCIIQLSKTTILCHSALSVLVYLPLQNFCVFQSFSILRGAILFSNIVVCQCFIPKSKTVMYRYGNTVVIYRADSNLCPVTSLGNVFFCGRIFLQIQMNLY